MFKDIKQSHDLRDKWRVHQQKHKLQSPIELNTNVLTSGFWPFSHSATCTLPRELVERCEQYKAFYTQAHSGRKIKFNTAMGTAELLVQFPLGAKQLIVSTYQMC